MAGVDIPEETFWPSIQAHIAASTPPAPLEVRCLICTDHLDIPGLPPPADGSGREPARVLWCGHVIGAQCARTWFRNAASAGPSEPAGVCCPSCRRDMYCSRCGLVYAEVLAGPAAAVPTRTMTPDRHTLSVCTHCSVREKARNHFERPSELGSRLRLLWDTGDVTAVPGRKDRLLWTAWAIVESAEFVDPTRPILPMDVIRAMATELDWARDMSVDEMVGVRSVLEDRIEYCEEKMDALVVARNGGPFRGLDEVLVRENVRGWSANWMSRNDDWIPEMFRRKYGYPTHGGDGGRHGHDHRHRHQHEHHHHPMATGAPRMPSRGAIPAAPASAPAMSSMFSSMFITTVPPRPLLRPDGSPNHVTLPLPSPSTGDHYPDEAMLRRVISDSVFDALVRYQEHQELMAAAAARRQG